MAGSFAALSLLVAAAGCNSAGAAGGEPRYASAETTVSSASSSSAATSNANGTTPSAAQRPVNSRSAVKQTLGADPHVIIDARKTLQYLASEELEGRGVGTKGLEEAADYIATRFAELGLRPLPGHNDYFQPFDYTSSSKIGKSSALKIDGKPFELRKDFTPASFSSEGTFTGPVVFAGYGIAAPEKYNGYDDYADVDVKGKVVLAMRFDPHNEKGKSRLTADGEWSPEAALAEKAKVAQARGAVALVLVNPPEHHGNRDRLLPFAAQYSGGAEIPVVQVKQEVANGILRKGGAPNLRELQKQIDESGKPSALALTGVTVSGNVDIERERQTVRNVMAMLPGANASEYVVIGAHYDHLGRGGQGSMRPHVNAIHYGADDNASGTTALIETARQLVRQGRPARSVVFVAFTVEEEGLLGSQHFVANPPIPLDRIVAMLNMDMVGRVRNAVMYIGGAGTAEPFDDLLRRVDDASPLEFKNMGRGGFGPSDHMSFALKKIPVLFFFSGMHPQYHTPADTPDRINYKGIAESVAAAHAIVNELATMPKSQYVATSDTEPMQLRPSGGGSDSDSDRDPAERPASLGVIPDYGSDQSTTGVRISGATDGTAAAAAGLKEGDVLTKWNGKKLGSLMDLSVFLRESKPGDKVKLTYVRDGKETEVEVTLKARGG